MDDIAPDDRDGGRSTSEGDGDSEPEVPADLMVVSRARRANAGNRMSTLLATSAQEDEWGEDWEEVANEEEFVGDDANEHEDYNLDSSSSEDEDQGDDDETGEKELRKAERQERTKKRKTAANPFAARLAAASRKRVKLDVPSASTHSSPAAPARPKKKSERASWIPTDEDGPTRTSSRKQTMANKEHTLAKLKEKDQRRDETLAMMKAAEARKAKDEPKPLTQAERLAEAARVERINKKTLHRWEEAEEQRAAERQAKIDALKNRQIDGPFIRFYSGPAIWVDDKIKFTGKDAPKLKDLEEKLNKETAVGTLEDHSAPDLHTDEQTTMSVDQPQTSLNGPIMPTSQSLGLNSQLLSTPASQAPTQDITISQGLPFANNVMFAPPSNPDSFLLETPPPPPPPRRKLIQRALRNLLILSSFPNLDAAAAPTRARSTASLLKEKDKAALVQLSTAVFNWSVPDATAFVTAMLNAPKTKKEKEALAKPKKELCAVSNKEAKYRDPETGIAYRDSRAFGVLRAKPMESRGKGFLGMAPAAGVPKRFLEMEKKAPEAPAVQAVGDPKPVETVLGEKVTTGNASERCEGPATEVKAEETATAA
ncbi:uncharacterized protein N0V89_003874 [Didymosphaeria variabile]|uniref:Vps72/YL1 C-terminal domain-containing protein n=1 Tax=Didymosphaeria variabile TaxID=1932322 RepID=A0A9W9CCR1_9PLEO|nr:uncharacterized protein N0V89_003874 [Didymosphaeria variabile]KAJ4355853.1 hypothetical protein N0V89_003874 [Didymosphaeria variabile]